MAAKVAADDTVAASPEQKLSPRNSIQPPARNI
jgi:hypothetical protein